MLGNFHLEMAFYGAVGTNINESGAEHLLTESGILAEGSLMGVIRGKHYNRCVRIHDILALAMERKLYERFQLILLPEKLDEIKYILKDMPNDVNLQDEFLSNNKCFQEHKAQYELFFQDVMKGKLVPTAQYWSIYVYMINRVHRELMHAVCTNDIDAYITILLILIYIYFALNRPNYARWGILCYFKLTNAAPQI